MPTFSQLLQEQAIILLDGAMGTELNRRGLDTTLPLWSAAALKTDPGTVTEIHRDYVSAGAQILIANTFRTTTYSFRQAGHDGKTARRLAREAAYQAVKVAKTAAGDRVLVAGSMAPVGDCYTPADYVGPAVAERTFAELSSWLADAGADLLILETHITLEEAKIALQAASATGLPVLVSFLADKNLRLWGGAALQEAAGAAEQGGAAAVLVNCVTLPVAAKVLPALVGMTGLPVGIYANAGLSQPAIDGTIGATVKDDRLAEAARSWVAQGARLIGGCCGTTPATISALREAVAPLDPNR